MAFKASFIVIAAKPINGSYVAGDYRVTIRYWTSRGNSEELTQTVTLVGANNAALKTDLFGKVRTFVNGRESTETSVLATPAPPVFSDPTRYDATNGTPTAIAPADVPPDSGLAPKLIVEV